MFATPADRRHRPLHESIPGSRESQVGLQADEVKSVSYNQVPSPRYRVLTLLVAALMLLPALPAQAVDDGTSITFEGSGWGHGVGMSQYGAYGMALNGRTAGQILNHYYSGTSVKNFSNTSAASFLSSDPNPLWVGLLQNRTGIAFTVSGGPADLCQGWGDDHKCIRANGGQMWRYHTRQDGRCIFERVSPENPLSGDPNDCDGSIRLIKDAEVTMGPEGYTYSWGVFRLREVPSSSPVKFHVSLETAIEPYIGGIHEVFASWPSQALRAQAIASRSYVLANASARGPQHLFGAGVKSSCWCHLYDDTRSQVFKGDYMDAFSSWQNAVSSTAGDVVAYGSTLVTAFYSSSSGGKTENVEDVWGGSGVPWLVSVDDHWAHIPEVNNWRSQWSEIRTAGSIASKVGLDKLEWINVSHRASGGVSKIVFGGTAGGQSKTVTRTGTWARSAFDLPSHYFDVKGIADSPDATAYDTSQNSSTPIGNLEKVENTGNGSFRARGWTLDFDTELPILVHIYVDGKFAKGLWANETRKDVARVYNNGDKHGFNATVGASSGSHNVCVYAINAPTKSGNPRIGCKTVNVSNSSSSSSSSASKPFGWIDGVSVSDGTLKTRGWAIDKDAPDKAVPIHIYVDGKFFQGGSAGKYRADVHRAHGLGKYHGFELSKSISSGSHRVCIYAINLPEKSGNPLLGCKTVSG